MRLTRLITLRSFAARRLRSFLTLFGIVIGVAGIFAINFTNQNAYLSITRLFEGTAGRVSLEVKSSANVGGMPEALLDDIAGIAGVDSVTGYLKLPAALPDENQDQIDLNFFGTGAGGLLLHGIDPQQDPLMRDYRITSGRFLAPGADQSEIVLAEAYALANTIAVGKTISILTAYGQSELAVVGLMADEGAGLTNLGKFGVITLEVAQDLSRRPAEVDQIDLIASGASGDPALLAALRTDLADRLGAEYAVDYPARQGDRMAQMLSGYQIGLNFMAGIALFVGAFLIYNTFSMTVVERTRELGLLRAVGLSRRQATGQVVTEGLLLGVIGALFGVAAGYLMAQGLMAIMSGLLGQPLDAGEVSPQLIATSLSVGLVVTLLAALLPARQAGRISPMEALRVRARTDEGWLLKFGWLVGLFLLIVSAAILVWNPFPYDVQFRLGSLTVFTLFFGATLIIPVTLRLWQFLGRWPIRFVFGGIGEIGSRNLERARKRTMLTCAALMVGVSMVVTTQGMIASFTADLYDWIDAYAGGDIFISGAVPLTYDLKTELEKIDGVEHAAPLRYIEVSWLRDDSEEKISLMAIDPDSYTQVTRFVFSKPAVDEQQAINRLAAGDAIFISGVIAEKYSVGPGDELVLQTRKGEKSFVVAAVVLDFYNQGLVVTGSWADLERYFEVNEVNTYLIKAADGANIDDLVSRIRLEYESEYKLVAESNRSLRKRADVLMRQAFSMFDILGILAVMIAALGVLNTLSMSVIERTREIGMLRSMGMTRWQNVRLILAEAFLMGIIGGLLGLGFGVVLTRIFLLAMGSMSGYDLEFVMPPRAYWLSLVISLVTSQLAALLPALRAARTPVLTAIQYE
jgi:putative ABC transport system permease protein